MISEGSSGFLDKVRETSVSHVNESTLPSREGLGYDSTVGVYGGKMVRDQEGKLVFDNRGIVSKIDKAGDAVLRTYDENLLRHSPLDLLRKHPKWFLKVINPNQPKRYRGTKEEIVRNAQRLGLGDVYGLHPWGVEVKKPEIFTQGRALQDIYRADLINSDKLNEIDRFQALAEAARYIREVHDKYGGIGELLSSDIIFQDFSEGKVGRPILNIPDEVYNPKKNISLTEQKATDMMDFLMNIGMEEMRRSGDESQARNAVDIILQDYNDKEIAKVVAMFIARGRLTFTEANSLLRVKMASQHNQARIGIKPEDTAKFKDLVKDASLSFSQP